MRRCRAGTGKTLIARQIGKMLNGNEPKIVNGPEVLNKYVGASEENIRNLFKEAEADYQKLGESSGGLRCNGSRQGSQAVYFSESHWSASQPAVQGPDPTVPAARLLRPAGLPSLSFSMQTCTSSSLMRSMPSARCEAARLMRHSPAPAAFACARMDDLFCASSVGCDHASMPRAGRVLPQSRGSVRDGSGVHDTIVNQLLTKIDGVDALNNILLIGMTNRWGGCWGCGSGRAWYPCMQYRGPLLLCLSALLQPSCNACRSELRDSCCPCQRPLCRRDMLDEALLRPGRLEVQVEIGLPDERGRVQILQVRHSAIRGARWLAACAMACGRSLCQPGCLLGSPPALCVACRPTWACCLFFMSCLACALLSLAPAPCRSTPAR